MQSKPLKPFGKLRNFFWPIHVHELKKLIPMFALFFLITFIYNLLRPLKMSLIVYAPGGSAAVIPYLKVWAVLPGALLMTYVFTRLANRYDREQIFYIMLAIFLGFFAFFLVILYPNREALELSQFADFCQQKLPKGFEGLVAIIRHWPLALFYVLAEIWSTIVLSMLFWGFANEVTSVDEAKRFYAIFALGANSSGVFSGQFAKLLRLQDPQASLMFLGQTAWEQSVSLSLVASLVCGLLVIWLFAWLNRCVIRPDIEASLKARPANFVVKPKNKITLSECFAYLGRSRYLLYITIIVVAYNIVYNLSDVLFTDQVQRRYPLASDFNAYMNQITSITGIIAVISALIISGNVIRRFGWTVAAMITPVIWFLTSVGFFSCLLFENTPVTDLMMGVLHLPLASLAIYFGTAQTALGRACKYTVFDETKEITFIPLSAENKRKGKAVVDGIASRFGKSGGSIIYQVLLITCGELALTIPYVAALFLVVITGWIIAVKALGKLVNHHIDEEAEDTADPSNDSEQSQNPLTV